MRKPSVFGAVGDDSAIFLRCVFNSKIGSEGLETETDQFRLFGRLKEEDEIERERGKQSALVGVRKEGSGQEN